jgi:hypothetical protein
MAERRMFAKTITESDAFLDMPLSAQALYFHLGMAADDDGFVNSPRKVQRAISANADDLLLLASKKFVIPFNSGVTVIKHWKMNNYIQRDRYKPTVYIEEAAMLGLDGNNAYTLSAPPIPCIQPVSTMDTDENEQKTGTGLMACDNDECIQPVSKMDTQVRLGKVRLGKERDREGTRTKRFAKPTVDEVHAYIAEKGYTIDAAAFCAYYESNGWMIGRNKMKSWHAACATWQAREKPKAVRSDENRIYD